MTVVKVEAQLDVSLPEIGPLEGGLGCTTAEIPEAWLCA